MLRIKTQWIWWCTLLLFLVLVNNTEAKAQSADELINEYRTWMAEHYPQPEGMDTETLFRTALWAIYNGQREPEVKVLLRAATPKVPELQAYVDWLDSRKSDPCSEASFLALQALTHAAGEQLGADHLTTGWCRLLLSIQLSTRQDVTAQVDQLIKDLQQPTTETNRERLSILCAARLSQFTNRLWERFVEDPEIYPELLKTEQEVLTLYPVQSETVDHTRAFLYYLLAEAKATLSHRAEAIWAQDLFGWQDSTGYFPMNNGIVSNADFYYYQAYQMYRNLYPEGHPEVINLQRSYIIFTYNCSTVNESILQGARLLDDYIQIYSPEGSVERMLIHTDLWTCRLMMGEPNPDAADCPALLKKLELCWGTDNYYYVNLLAFMAVFAEISGLAEAENILDKFDALLDRRYATQPLKKAYLLNYVYSSLKGHFPERTTERMEQVHTLYRAHHDFSMLSIDLGRKLVENSRSGSSNNRLAVEMQGYVCADTKARYGASSRVTFAEEQDLAVLTANTDIEKADMLFSDLIARMQAAGADCTEARNAYLDYLYFVEKYPQALELCRLLIADTVHGTQNKRCNQLLIYTVLLGKTGGSKTERADSYAKAARMLTAIEDSLNFNTYNFELAAGYLVEKGRYQEAVDMLDRGIALNQWQTGGNVADQNYLSMAASKNEILYDNLNQITEAKRLINQQLQDYTPDRITHYTPAILNFLMRCYNLIYTENSRDFAQLSPLMSSITKITFKLHSQSGQDPDFLMRYVTEAITMCVDFLIETKKLDNRLDRELMTDEQKKFWQQYTDLLFTYQEPMKDVLILLEEEIEKFGFTRQTRNKYTTLIYYLAHYYQTLEPNPQKALHYMKRYVELRKEKPLDIFYAWISLGDVYDEQQQPTQALEAYLEAEKQLPQLEQIAPVDQTALESRLCGLYYQQGQFTKALPHARRYYTSIRWIMDGNFQLMTENEQNNFMETYMDPAFWLTTLLEAMPDSLAAEAYDAVLYRTGMQLRSQRQTLQAIRQSGDSVLVAALDSLDRLRIHQRSIRMNPYENPKDIETENEQIRLTYAANVLEQQIIEASEPYRKRYALHVGWDEIRQKLAPDEAAIEFVYAGKHVMALVVRPDSPSPRPVRLVESDTLVTRLKALNANTSARLAVKLYNEQAVDLYGMLWAPLEPCLQGVRTIYFTTPGILNNLSFAAFATPNGSYLTDKYRLCQLTTTAALLQPREARQTPRSALLMGDIYYSPRQQLLADSGRADEARGADDDLALDDFDNRGVSREHFKYLPFTGDELTNIEHQLTAHRLSSSDLTVRKGTSATEAAFKELAARKPEVIHLATHGFFVAYDHDVSRIPYYRQRMQNMANSMRRAGIALAGAEAAWCGAEGHDENDGILTADEVARFDLHGTRLVVLSACETALGDYSFEGVYGLPRGFKQAGVESLLVSLWSVNDRSTALLMSEFYRYWLEGKPVREALEHAVREVRKQYPQPYYWAPFVLLD